MRNIEQLRAAGFKVEIAQDFVNCTDISHPEMFYWFKHKLVASPSRLESSIIPAGSLPQGGFGFTLAGQYSDNAADLPCTFLSAQERKEIGDLFKAAENARAEAEAKEGAYIRKVDQIMHGVD
jgi:hypothetical protein